MPSIVYWCCIDVSDSNINQLSVCHVEANAKYRITHLFFLCVSILQQSFCSWILQCLIFISVQNYFPLTFSVIGFWSILMCKTIKRRMNIYFRCKKRDLFIGYWIHLIWFVTYWPNNIFIFHKYTFSQITIKQIKLFTCFLWSFPVVLIHLEILKTARILLKRPTLNIYQYSDDIPFFF